MIIYGTALLATCHIVGILLGELLGQALGVKTNVGGVGIAMLLLILARWQLQRRGWLTSLTERGVHYWGAIYIPIVVAMSMQQNVVAALRGGPVVVIAAVGTVVLCGMLVSAINRMETPPVDEDKPEPKE
jgi:malonate transporter MadL subunit